MKYAIVDEKSKPDNTSVPMIKGNMARLTLYRKCDFSALSRMNSKVERTRLPIGSSCRRQLSFER